MSEATLTRDVVNGVRGLEAAVDALARIAEFGGVQGNWATEALKQVNELITGKTERRCRRCWILAEDAAKQAEPICSENGLVTSHVFVDMPVQRSRR